MSNAQIESSRAAESEIVQPKEITKAVAVGTIGNVLEWFDFGVYGYFAPFIGKLFFPRSDPLASMFAAFAVLAVGALSRPLGAVVFGWIGDREGRRTSLTATVWLMAVATFMVGILPTYTQIGVLAPTLLVVARLLQGLSSGGEWGGSAAYMVEYAPLNRRGFIGSFQQVSTGAGFFFGSLFGLIVTSTMSEQTIFGWAWRLPFLSVMLLGFVLLLPAMGALSDRIGRRPMLLAAPLILILATYPLFLLIIQGSLRTILSCQLVFGVLLAAYCGPAVAATVELFPTKLRYTSVSIGFNLAVALIGITSPMISTHLISGLGP